MTNFYIHWHSAAVLRYSTTNFQLLYATWAMTLSHNSQEPQLAELIKDYYKD
jgi:hypothetical protein